MTKPKLKITREPEEGAPTVDDIYMAYPRHVRPGYAKERINKALELLCKRFNGDMDLALSWLMMRTEKYAKAPDTREKLRSKSERKMIPHPSTWFNQGGYDTDDIEWGYGEDDGVPAFAKANKSVQRMMGQFVEELSQVAASNWSREQKLDYMRNYLVGRVPKSMRKAKEIVDIVNKVKGV